MIGLKIFIPKFNVGRVDHLLRIIIGILLLGMADMNVVGVWGWFGVFPLITGALRYCPIYSLLAINTCRESKYVE